MTEREPLVRDDLAFLRASTRPGSIEARKVWECTCTEDLDRKRVWNPDQVASWQADIDLVCPAHGRLLEAYLAHVNETLGRSAEEVREVMERVVVDHAIKKVTTRAARRSLAARVGDAWRGMMQGWRGGAV